MITDPEKCVRVAKKMLKSAPHVPKAKDTWCNT